MPNSPPKSCQSQLRNAIDSLAESLRLQQLILVVGPEVLTVQLAGADGGFRQAPFYRLVAERLLESQQLPMDLLDVPGPSWDLHRACAAILTHTGISAGRLRRSVSTTIRELAAQVAPVDALTALAGLECFDLIVCLTPDDLLLRSIQTARPDLSVSIASYSPRTGTDQDIDVPSRRHGLLRLHHLLGRVEDTTEIAIHEEDALEYLHRFRDDAERRAKTLLTEIRGSDKLFLGCGLPDWMARGLMRLFNSERLIADDRTFEFFCAGARDASLNGFLDQFSHNSIVFPWAPLEFVHEISMLASHTQDRDSIRREMPPDTHLERRSPSAFISYASEDADAAQRITQALKTLGFGKVWFDREALIPGDHWPDKIEEAIGACDFFVPVLSRQADRRREGVYWEEWRHAMERSLRINEEFLLPIGIDADPPIKSGYERIFTGWTRPLGDLHLLHAPQGHLSDADRDQLTRRVQAFSGGRS